MKQKRILIGILALVLMCLTGINLFGGGDYPGVCPISYGFFKVDDNTSVSDYGSVRVQNGKSIKLTVFFKSTQYLNPFELPATNTEKWWIEKGGSADGSLTVFTNTNKNVSYATYTGKKPGEETVCVQYKHHLGAVPGINFGYCYHTVHIIIKVDGLSSLEINSPNSVAVGGTINCTCTAKYSDGTSKTVTPTWSITSGDNYASISPSGSLTGKADGIVTIQAQFTDSGVTKTVTKNVTVGTGKPVTLSSISISGSDSVNAGSTETYTCTATYSNGTTKTVTPTWSISSGASYATISNSGVLNGKAGGTVTIKADYEGKTATKNVTVSTPKSIEISGSSSVNVASTATYTCTVTDSNGKIRTVTPTWDISSGYSYASITAGGVLTPKNVGRVTIKASYTEGGVTKTATKDVTINGPVSLSLTTDSSGNNVMCGSTIKCICTVKYYDGTSKILTPNWSISSGDSYASITAEGVLTGKAYGSATVKASYTEGPVTKTETMTVYVDELSSVTISGASSLNVGSTENYSCTARYRRSSSTKTVNATWSIYSGASYASITSDGVLTGKAEGSVTIKASYTEGGVTKTETKSVKVTEQGQGESVTLSSISISGSGNVNVGSTATYTCTATYSNGTTKTVTPTWSISSGTSYASITGGGILTGKAAGTATVKATYEGKTATLNVAVISEGGTGVPKITTQPKSQTVNEGSSVTFSVTAEDPGSGKTNFNISLYGNTQLDMIWIKPGTFMMGSPEYELGRFDEEIQHQVILTQGYWLGKYEVTQAQYEAVMGTNPSYFKGADLPVEQVSWYDATNFCAKLTASEKAAGRLPSGYAYTLPTEAQWEYACRAGTTTAFNNGTNIETEYQSECPNLDPLAWYRHNSGSKTHPVGQKQPNAWGLYDMHGNVWEWCLDWYRAYPTTAVTDPVGPSTGSIRVLRGGSWHDYASLCRSAFRYRIDPDGSYYSYGFRVALAPVRSESGSFLSYAEQMSEVLPEGEQAENGGPLAASGAMSPSRTAVAAADTLTYQWYKDGAAISGATASSYTIKSVKASDAGKYTVKVSNSAGSVTSSAATLTVNTTSATLSSITINGNSSVNVGSTATYTCTATYSNGTTKTVTPTWSISSGTSYASITAAGVLTGKAAGTATVQAKYTEGSVTKTATKNVTVNATAVKPTITTQPKSQTVSAGSSVTFSVVASGTAPLSYQWYKGTSKISGATSSTYKISSVKTSDAGSYTVTVSNSAGSVTSSAATLKVSGGGNSNLLLDFQFNEGKGLTSASSVGSAVLTMNDGQTIPWSISTPARDADPSLTDDFSVFVDNEGTSGYARKYGVFDCDAIDFGDTSDASFTLEAWFKGLAKSSLKQVFFQTWSSTTGRCPRLSFAIDKDFTVYITTLGVMDIYTGAKIPEDGGWHHIACAFDQKNKKLITYVDGKVASDSPRNNNASGDPLSNWNVNFATQVSDSNVGIIGAEHSGYAPFTGYVDRIRFWKGALSADQLDYNDYKPVITQPEIMTQPKSQTVNAGSSVTFSVTATGTVPLSYQWYKGSSKISGATSSSYKIDSVTSSDAGSYTVTVSNSAGSVTSSAATLTVNVPVTLSSITISGNSSVNVGSTATYTCTATYSDGTSKTVTPTWSISSGTSYASITSGGVLTGKAAGTATVQAKYTEGGVTKTATKNVTVNAVAVKPSITTQPKSQTVTEGDSVTFSVTATGTAPLSYQWKKNGSNISGATSSSYKINSAKTSDVGSYTVTVSNSAGSVTSSTATLTVNASVVLPKIITQPKSQTVNEGESVTFSVVAEGGSSSGNADFSVPLSSSVNLDMVWINPGTFIMGSPENELGRNIDGGDETQHQVTLTKGYWLGKYEITQAQYQTVMGNNPSYFKESNLPVESVSWFDATNFCAKLTEIEKAAGRLPEGYEYTLPTEAQWEYACRAGTTTALNSGKNLTSEYEECSNMNEVGWYEYNSNSTTHPVGQKRPNAWGLYDMHGNVWEWCLDWYGAYPTSAVTDPVGPNTGSFRILRGNSWLDPALYSRSAERLHYIYPDHTAYADCGFRVALSQVQAQASAAASDTLTYQWYKDGNPISGATGSSYTINNVKASDAGKYTVKVCNNAGCVISEIATLTVNASVVMPKIITQPKSQTVNEGESVTFSVVAEGGSSSGNADFSVPLSSSVNLDMVWINPGTFMMGSPENEPARATDEIQHQVTLTKGYWLGKYEITQTQYEVIMGTNPSYFSGNNNPVERVSWYDAMNFCAELTVQERAMGRLPEGYEYTLPTEAQWEYACRAKTTTAFNNGTDLPAGDDIFGPCSNLDSIAWYYYNSDGKTHPVGQKQPNAWGLYDMSGNVEEWCLDWYGDYPTSAVTDPVGPSTGSDCVLRGGCWLFYPDGCRSADRYDIRPSWGDGSDNGFRVALVPVQPQASAAASDTLTYQWYKDGKAISGATGSSYTIVNVKASDAGKYTVKVCNSAGCVTSEIATLTVNVKPTITTQPKSQTVNEGSSATFSVTATGTAPLKYQWYKDTSKISGATSSSYKINNVTISDAGSYTVIVSNSAGSVASSSATLTVNVPVTLSSISINGSSSVNVGSTATYTCTATYSDGTTKTVTPNWAISSGTSYASITSGGVLTGKAAGTATVQAKYTEGSVTKTATKNVTVNVVAVKPSITTQPKSQTVNEGSSVTFSVVATGTAPLSYQWKKDGSNISGATGVSYTINSAKSGDAGSYTVTVSNSAGNVTSSAATLTVTFKPAITTQPKSQSVDEGDSVTFSVVASGTAPLKYQWKKNGSNISGATGASYTISSAKSSDAGSYTVTVSNSAGNVNSSVATLTVKSTAKITVERSFPAGYIPGKTADVILTISGTVKLSSLSFTEILPSGWTFNSMVEDGGMDIKPTEGTSGTLNFLWFMSEVPALPFSVTYRVNVPQGADGDYLWSGTFIWADSQGMPAEETIGGETSIWKGKLYHSGDYSPANWKFDMIEMVRLSQLYRAGGYHVDTTSADGYAPGSGSQNGETHSGDYSPANWKFDMIEMVRLSQLYRAGGYHLDSSTADGYAPGVEAAAVAASESAVEVNARRTIGEIGDTMDISITIAGEGTLAALSLVEILPDGWTFNSMVEDGGMDIKPESGATGNLEFLWFMSEVPELPFTVTYRVNVPKEEGTYEWNGEIIWASLSEEPEQRMIEGENSVTVTNTEEAPELSFILSDDGMTLILEFTGMLYESEDTVNWTEVEEARSPYSVDITQGKKFYRCAQ